MLVELPHGSLWYYCPGSVQRPFRQSIRPLGLAQKNTTNEGLRMAGFYSLTILKAGSPNSKFQQAWFLQRAVAETLFCASLPASGGLQAILGPSQHHPNLSLHIHMTFFLCVCVCTSVCASISPPSYNTSHIG